MDNRSYAQLQRHNQYRSKHNAPPLTLSFELSNIAQRWAERLAYENVMKHSGDSFQGQSMGENLFWYSDQPWGGQASDAWYDEVKDYDYNRSDGCFPQCGHFTQLVWQGSQQVGFGYSGGYVVANYFPAGNYQGQYLQNVTQ